MGMRLEEMSPRSRSLVVLLAALMGVAATANLGAWQLRRADQKLAVQRAIDQRAQLPELAETQLARTPAQAQTQHYRRVRLHGRWLERATVWLDNRQMNGWPGFFVVTPLQLDPGHGVVLVQRGWAPRNSADRTRLPPVASPAGEVTVVGHVAPPPGRLYEFAPEASGPIRQNLDLAAFARETGLALAPLSVLQDEAPAGIDDGLLRQWPRPAVNVQTNYGYAVQWFALSALMAGLYVWFQLVRPRWKRDARA